VKVYPQDPRLTAFLLDELDPAEAHKIREAINTDPALQETLAELKLARADLAESLTFSSSVALLPAQREAIMQEARSVDQNAKITSFARLLQGWKPYGISLAAAAVVALILLLKTNPESKPAPTALARPMPPIPEQVALAPPAPVKPTALPSGNFVNPSATASLTVVENPALPLPMSKDKHGLALITQAIRTERQLPAAASVQLEEILNALPLKLNAITAIARRPKPNWHPDVRETGMSAHAATLGAETLPCPWKPSATLLLVSIRGNATDACQAKMVFHPNPENVSRYRLLGYSASKDNSPAEAPSLLEAGASTTLAIEIESNNSAGDFGTLSWTIDGQPAPTLSVRHVAASEPSDDARFAALICSFSQWLSGGNTGLLDRDLLAALARENGAENLAPERADFLALVREALEIK